MRGPTLATIVDTINAAMATVVADSPTLGLTFAPVGDDDVSKSFQTPSSSARPMTPGACVLCACVSARRWYVIAEGEVSPGP